MTPALFLLIPFAAVWFGLGVLYARWAISLRPGQLGPRAPSTAAAA